MAQNVISTAILIIAAVIAVVALINGVFPAVYRMSGSVSSVTDASNDRMNTEIRIIYVCANRSEDHSINVFVKNTGTKKVPGGKIPYIDVYYGSAGAGMTKAASGGPSYPYRDASIAEGNGDADWDPGETLDIWVHTGGYDFLSGRQQATVVLANGVSDELEYTLL
jgi:flagellar protein FlaG